LAAYQSIGVLTFGGSVYAEMKKIVQKADLLMQCSTLQAAVMPKSLITDLGSADNSGTLV
jgi:hypothetical protein